MALSAEDRIRYQSLLVALEALDRAEQDIRLVTCEHGHISIEGEAGNVSYDPEEGEWVFDGVDGTVIYA